MKITEEEVKQFIEILQQVEQFRPLVNLALDSAKSFGPEIKDLVQTTLVGISDINSEVFKNYVNNGFSREEALTLVINQNLSFTKFVDKMSVKK